MPLIAGWLLIILDSRSIFKLFGLITEYEIEDYNIQQS